MPDFNRPAGQWLGSTLAQTKRTAAALAAQSTEYIVDSGGVCRAIIGHLVAEPSGTATGLSGWGIAVKTAAGAWIALSAQPLYGPFEAFSTDLPVAGEEHTVEIAHGMPTTPVTVFGGLQDGFYSPCLGWRWTATSTDIAITFHTLQSQTKVEGYLHFMAR